MIGVVIPTLNEATYLRRLLADLAHLACTVPLDIVVVDGGSTDDTIARAAADGTRVLTVTRGRAGQLNAGAGVVSGDWLLFLHADSRLPPAARRALLAAVADEPELAAAVFRFAIELPWPWKAFIEVGQAVRERLYHLPYGDQGLLIRRSLFQAIGGYPDLPIMEDVALVRALARRGVALRRLPGTLITSGRRYHAHGVLRTWLRNAFLILLYLVGVSPQRLARWRAG